MIWKIHKAHFQKNLNMFRYVNKVQANSVIIEKMLLHLKCVADNLG